MIFENGTLIKGAYVIIDGVEYEVHAPEYSGDTPVSSENLNKMQDDLRDELKTKISNLDIVWESGITPIDGTENSLKVDEQEKSCTLIFAINSSQEISSNYILGHFDTAYAPKKQCIGAGICSTNTSTEACQLSVYLDGGIVVNNFGKTSNTIRGQIKWFYGD